MIKMTFKVAIVGRSNVGKSSLFNRILNKRLSIIDEISGTTKDRIYAQANWLNQNFIIIDTGGIEINNICLKEKIKYQTETAINESHLVVFVTDGQTRLVQEDLDIARILYKKQKKIIVAVNKIDNYTFLENIYEFYSLGFSNVIGISAIHKIGIGELLDKIISYCPRNVEYSVKVKNYLKFCLIGKPNVGKSTFVNALLSQERMIVSEVPGTTTDQVDTIFEKKNQTYKIIDTAGLKKRGQMYKQQDKYSYLRTLDALDKSDIICFILDASQKITEQDKNIAALIFQSEKACIIIGNKWDLTSELDKDTPKFEKKIRNELKFFDYIPILCLSSLTKQRINKFLPLLDKIFNHYQQTFSDHLLNDILYEATQINPPSIFNQGKAKFYYIKQISTKPPKFICLVNDPKFIHFSYERFLKNQLRLNLKLEGLPLKIIFRKKETNFI
ncbi:ribosome biogenesis GTPase Der [Candidatus Phytoplasma melaleucae]